MTRFFSFQTARRPLITLLMTTVLTVTLLLSTRTPAQADWTPGVRMAQAIGKVVGSARYLSGRSQYGFDRDICVLGAFVGQRQSVAFRRSFSAGTRYVILGGGDDFASDLDIEIRNASGLRVAQDTDDDASPVVSFTPTRSGTYTLRLTHYAGQGSAFAAVTVLSTDGYTVPMSNLVRATSRCLAMAAAMEQRNNCNVQFIDAENQWAVYGTVLPSGSNIQIDGLRPGAGGHAFLAAGDGNADDVDLILLNSAGALLESDVEKDDVPLVTRQTLTGNLYSLRILNQMSAGPSLVITAGLKITARSERTVTRYTPL